MPPRFIARGYSLTIEQREDFVHALIEGPEHGFAVLHASWSEILAELRRREAKRLIVVDALRGTPALHELVEIVNSVLAPALAGVRVALVDAGDADRRYLEFAEVLLRRQGVAAHAFGSERSALEWLRAIGWKRNAA
jgi:hypothetical protein